MKEIIYPPSVESLREAAGIEEDDLMEILAYLTKEKVLVKINPDMYFLQNALEEGKNRLNQYFEQEKELSLATFRDMLNTTRKYALPLLEYYDKIRFTHRVGDARIKTK